MTEATKATLTAAVRSALEVVGLETIRTQEFFGTNERKPMLLKAA